MVKALDPVLPGIGQIPQDPQPVIVLEAEVLGPALDQANDRRRVDIRLGMEMHLSTLMPQIDLANTERCGPDLERGELE